MKSLIRGTEFNYQIDTEYGINRDGFIAEGTESIVFKGVKCGDNLKYSCALKFKPKSRLHDFMNREYRILESMQTCRSVVRILDVIEDLGDFSLTYKGVEDRISNQGYFCVVEEYIDGDSLQDYCIKQWYEYDTDTKRWERNSTEHSYREVVKFQNQIIQFMINLCEIMKFVSNINEQNGKSNSNAPIILHCDIKPENIMVTKHGKELVLIDFGRSQSIMKGRTYQHYSDKTAMSFTADYSDEQWQDVGKDNFYSYGTVGYAAPECYASPIGGLFPFISQRPALTHGCVSVESDIFGFGATFFECLSIYEICEKAFEREPNSTDPLFFNDKIKKIAEANVSRGITEKYCDRDFRGIDNAFHEALEDIIRKCTKTRYVGFQKPEETSATYYHNFYQLQSDIERARDIIPSLDRKSDPLVRQMIGISGFCAAFGNCFLILTFILALLANPMAKDRWNQLKKNYTDNQKRTTFSAVAEDMMKVPLEKSRKNNLHDILDFTYGGKPNDYVVDSDEADIIVSLMKKYISNQNSWTSYIDSIIQNGKSDNMDEIAKTIYRLNLSSEYSSDGYILSKTLTQVNDADDSDTDTLQEAYKTLMEYSDDKSYRKIVSKIAIKLMSGQKIDTIANSENTNRESIQNELAPLTKIGGD